MKHANVAIFVPFAGCPQRCSFCNQHRITGTVHMPAADDVRAAIESAINSLKENTYTSEIAFFGGSFTAIDRDKMLMLLDATVPFIERFRGIRISTRPDAIDDEVLDLLASYHVTSIELGAQSMSDEVLRLNRRGHTADDVRRACSLIRAHGFELGLQMMTGLYGSTDALDKMTAREFIRLRPNTVRIYPTVVLRGTELASLYEQGVYTPPTVDEAVGLCTELIPMFEASGVRVIRVGLHDEPSLRENMIAGAFHPSFRELCESRIMLERLIELLRDVPAGEITVRVSPRSVSKLTGNRKSNIHKLSELSYTLHMIPDPAVPDGEIILC